jgi:hypothetical protein
MLRSTRLVFRMHQFEIVAVGLIAGRRSSAAALYVANELNAVGYGSCYLSATPAAKLRGARAAGSSTSRPPMPAPLRHS